VTSDKKQAKSSGRRRQKATVCASPPGQEFADRVNVSLSCIGVADVGREEFEEPPGGLLAGRMNYRQ